MQQEDVAQDWGPYTLNEVDSETSTPARSIEEALSCRHVRKAWALFLKHYPSRTCPAIENPAPDDAPLLANDRIFLQLSDSIKTGFCNWSNLQITPTQVLFRYAQLGIHNPALWNNAIGYLTDQLLWSISDGRTDDGKRRNSKALLNEVLFLWRLLFQCKGSVSDPLEAINPDWPAISDFLSFMNQPQVTSNFGQRLHQFHPQMHSSPALQFSAITLFNLFDDVNQESFKVPKLLKEQTAPFTRLLTTALAGSQIPSALKHIDYSSSFKKLPKDFQAAIIDQVKSAPTQAMKKIALRSANKGDEAELDPKELSDIEKAENLARFYISQVDNAVSNHSHVRRLEKVWEDVKVAYKLPDQKTAIPPLLYNALLSGFMNLRQPQQTVMVWNHMIASGIKPEMRTWVAMLEGCTSAKDLDGFNAIWGRMLKTGANPDVYAWNTRIHGLISFRQINMAFAAMDEMGNRWLAAEKAIQDRPKLLKGRKPPSPAPKTNVCAKPTVEVINGALSAFVQKNGPRDLRFEQKLQSMQKILQWAGQFDVKPNTYTYNILIQLYIGAGDYPTTFKLLKQMEQEGVEGDLVTHTMLIRAAFNNQKFDSLSESEQADRILTLFSELEAGGLKLNDRVYSITIDRLLKVYSNFSAARTLIEHMTSRNISPEPAVYASLITHYFQESPPNIEAVDSLMLQIFGPPRARTDKFFFDRVLEGYATCGEIGRMMSVLARMSSHGNLPGYRALTSVVRALAAAGDWERARMVVKDVQNGEGVAKGGVTGGRELESKFFSTVQQLGGNLTEALAGEHLRAAKPVRLGQLEKAGELADVDPEAATAADWSGVSGIDHNLETAGIADIEEPTHRRQEVVDADEEYVHAEHAGYLSDEPERKAK
jgi:pentatricopeptide repeat protein